LPTERSELKQRLNQVPNRTLARRVSFSRYLTTRYEREIDVKIISLPALDKFHGDFTLMERCVDECSVECSQVQIEHLIYFGERVVTSTASVQNAVVCSVDVAGFDLDSL